MYNVQSLIHLYSPCWHCTLSNFKFVSTAKIQILEEEANVALIFSKKVHQINGEK